jgi:hypothetical protein
MGSITSIKFIPANTFCELVESITRWKWAKRTCKIFRSLHHRVIELATHLSLGRKEEAVLLVAEMGLLAVSHLVAFEHRQFACLIRQHASRKTTTSSPSKARTGELE